MIATVLSALGLGEELPRAHTERAAELATRKAKIAAAQAAEAERAQAALVAAREKAESETTAQQLRFDAYDLKLADDLAADTVSACSSLFAAAFSEPTRKIASDLAAQLLKSNEASQETLGRPLTPWLVAASAAAAMIDAKPECLSAFVEAESFHDPVIGCATRLLQAALDKAETVTIFNCIGDLETALASRIRHRGGRPCTAEHKQQWAAIVGSGRDADRATKLAASAEHYGRLRQKAFADEYVAPTSPIRSHVRPADVI